MHRGRILPSLSLSSLLLTTFLGLAVAYAAGQTETTIFNFNGSTDGAWPKAGLVVGSNGDLYGATQYGGTGCSPSGCGTVYTLAYSNGAWTENVIYDFLDVNDGAGPIGRITFDASGNIYGTTAFGMPYEKGTIYELTPNFFGGWSASLLYAFTGGADGNQPMTGLTFDQVGNLYGTTLFGGTGDGVLFELSPNVNGTWTEKVIHAFGAYDGDGISPSTGVAIDAGGNLYGATASGGADNQGTIYEFSPGPGGTWNESILHSFVGKFDGSQPDALIMDKNANLYGAAGGGGILTQTGDPGSGTIFRLVRAGGGTWRFAPLYTFDGTTGAVPNGLVIDNSGNLFGTTNSGGSSIYGVAFELQRPSAGNPWTYSMLYDFANGGGIEPQGLIINFGELYGTNLTSTCYLCGTVWQIIP
jgi:uncharacterized repeat protein (TIGR03803 family)